jgi:hypothetical protein
MLRLVLDGNEMDLYDNESVNLTLQFADIQNINTATGTFSQTFRLPATDNNLDFFGFIDNPSSVDGINMKQNIEAELYTDSVPIVSGFCQVKNIYQQKEKYADIEVLFLGAPSLRSKINGKLLSDLDLSAYDHTLNIANIQDSWAATGSLPFAGEVRYGLIDKGSNWSVPENPPWTDTNGLYQGELSPFIRAKDIFDAIMDEAGYTYDSDFLDGTGSGNFSEIYMPCIANQTIASEDAEDESAGVGLNGDMTGTYALNKLLLVDNIANGSDPSDNWTNTGGYEYTVPESGYYKLDFHCRWEKTTSAHFVKVYLYKNGASIGTLIDTTASSSGFTIPRVSASGDTIFDTVQFQDAANAGLINNTVTTNGFFFETGDTISIYRELSGTTAKIWGGSTGTPTVGLWSTTWLTITPTIDVSSGLNVTMAENVPEMQQLDFVLGLQQMFNLVFVPDKNKPNHLLIEPFTDYTSTGTAKDWTDRVDYDMDVTITPTTDLQAQKYQWTYQPGNDFISDIIQKSLDRVYGRYQVLDVDNDFATGEKTIQTTFAQYITSLIPGTAYPIHRSMNADGSAVEKPLPMLAYWGGLSNQFGTWYMWNDAESAVLSGTLWPMFSNYSTDFPTVGDKDLNYGMEHPFFPIEANPANTLYFEHWAQWVAELYSEEARLLKCTMRLSKVDLADFEFSDRIFIKDSYYRVRRLNYDANVEGVCDVELIKELSDIEVCADEPTGYASRYNFILFNNSTEADPDYGSKRCCELYGYNWVKNTTSHGSVTPANLCKPKLQTPQPQ